MKKLINFFKEDEGATMPEYALMIALIAVICLGAVTAIGTAANTSFTNTASAISGS